VGKKLTQNKFSTKSISVFGVTLKSPFILIFISALETENNIRILNHLRSKSFFVYLLVQWQQLLQFLIVFNSHYTFQYLTHLYYSDLLSTAAERYPLFYLYYVFIILWLCTICVCFHTVNFIGMESQITIQSFQCNFFSNLIFALSMRRVIFI